MDMKKIVSILSVTLLMASCNGPLDIKGLIVGSSPDANTRYAQSLAWNTDHGFQSIDVEREDYQLYVCTDAHIANSSEGLTKFVEDYLDDGSAVPFALYLGDAMDGRKVYDLFQQTVAPIALGGRQLFSTPGNHDLYYNLWTEYISYEKTATYTFTVNTPSGAKDLYICLDSASGTLGTEQRAWLGHLLTAPADIVPYRNIIVFTHTHFFKRDNSQEYTSNYNIEETYDLTNLFQEGKVDLVLTGHDHLFEETVFKGVRYLTLNAISDKEKSAYYYKINVSDLKPEWVSVRIR